ncbi:Peptidase M23 [Solidesulfovibrio carbinoliphilus subsp. oakridgensis]|uniref:Peptidase M23 n=1 Tax=Solidesulfovibrio carbinoliphilus subsp. oakridgensis TaxID=694327 RepID=G7Q7F3_9BACT|nr:peptidoglycan DD-metalloendopeptidase family protein [Solidesulfovibrio carbinoliphilus]EHJ47106.1 Peptidase M23 [Solidesulfovibrio carbinoliphilus subsp. oakridgensis]
MASFSVRSFLSRLLQGSRAHGLALSLALLVLLGGAAGLSVFFPAQPQPVFQGPPALLVEACPPWADALCEPRDNLFARTEEDPSEEVLSGAVKSGQTLGGILGDYLDAGLLAALRDPADASLARIQPGQPYRLTVRDQELVSFEYEISPTETLVIDSAAGKLLARVETKEQETRQAVLAGTVDSSLFQAVEAAGGDAGTAAALAEVFACDIDFCNDVQPGDTFRAVVEKRYVDGKFIGLGRVLAARFTNQGKTHEGFALPVAAGRTEYCDASGRPLRKAFLRAPLSFLRITSGFSGSRLHPILNVRKAHFGVDYAAPTGTPVWSVGDGVVVERGRNAAAGNYVTVRHGATWVTRYNHLSRFAKGLDKGTKVAQGETIGYVGQTGLATGPHLDFRIYKNGQPVNALANPEMQADPLPAARLAAFKREAGRLAALLDRDPESKVLADREPKNVRRLQ